MGVAQYNGNIPAPPTFHIKIKYQLYKSKDKSGHKLISMLTLGFRGTLKHGYRVGQQATINGLLYTCGVHVLGNSQSLYSLV